MGRFGRRLELSDGRDAFGRRVWRQRPAVAVSAHQVRTFVLRCAATGSTFLLLLFVVERLSLVCTRLLLTSEESRKTLVPQDGPQDGRALSLCPPLSLSTAGIGRRALSMFSHAIFGVDFRNYRLLPTYLAFGV